MIMISDGLYIDILHAVFINNNFINGEEDCNYEKYLLELVNCSIYFRKKSNFKEYKSPPSESNGECDCNSPFYKLDFKLLDSTTRLQASKELTGQIVKICEGVTSHCSPRKQNAKMEVTILLNAIKDCSCENLLYYLSNEFKYGTIEQDIKNYVNLLNVKKNILFFFPYQFSFKKHYNFRFALEKINITLTKYFKESHLFRQNHCKEYDTFLAYIYDDNLIVNKFEQDDNLQIVDVIFLFKSETYINLYNYVSD